MKSIWKFPLEIADIQTIKVPKNSIFLCLKTQNDVPATYWEVNTNETLSYYYVFYIFGTGHPLENTQNLHYIDSVVCNDGNLVWHVYCKHDIKGIKIIKGL